MKTELNGVTYNIYQQGSGDPALVFLHYFGGSSRAWAAVIAPLAKEFRCIAPDLRGFGDSAAPPSGYSVRDYVADVVALVDTLELMHYVVVGHSMGGKFALAFAARQPRGLTSLVLLAPSPPTPEPMDDRERQRLLDGFGKPAATAETLRKITAQPLPAPLREQFIEDNLRSSKAAWDAWLEHGSREDVSDQMSGVNVPVVALSGTKDRAIPTDVVEREVVQWIKATRLTTLPDVGHLLPLEAP
ncbi:MAG: alpha/beta hydrolase [Candidatus Chloroheliales bacterium]|nr:MAG: alpha/beta hydrolase [Chloroflexota bacterium]